MKIEELENELKNDKIEAIYLLYGPETFLLESCLKKIKKNFGELLLGINYIALDESNVENIISDIETPAFGYERKLIIVKNSLLFKKEGKKKTAKMSDLRDHLNEYIQKQIDMIRQSIVLVFMEEEVEKNELYKTIEKIGVVCEFDFQKPIQIAKRIKSICNAYKVNITDVTIQYFIQYCGTNMQVLINEIRKLIEYIGENGTIQKEDIDKLSTKQFDVVIFDLTDSLGKKDIFHSMQILNDLIYQKEPLQKILITIYNHIKKLYITKLAEEYKKDLAESLKLRPNQMFLTSKYKTQAKLFEKENLRIMIHELSMLDVNYKSGLIDLKIGLESILCMYCS